MDQPQAALPGGLTVDDLIGEAGGEEGLSPELLEERLKEDAHAAYDGREEELGAEAVRELERQVLLAVIDRKWREHLYEMDYLQEGVGLRAYAQRDPLVEYQREGFDMFQQMLDGIKEEAVGFLFNLEVQVEEAGRPRSASRTSRSTPRASAASGCRATCSTRRPRSTAKPGRARSRSSSRSPRRRWVSAPERPPAGGRRGGGRPAGRPRPARRERRRDGESGAPVAAARWVSGRTRAVPRVRRRHAGPARRRRPRPVPASRRPARRPPAVARRRNAPCYCGSGKKYKRCHGAPGAA